MAARRSGLDRGTRLLLEMGRITRDNQGRDDALSRIAGLMLRSFKVEAVAILVYDQPSRSAYVSASASVREDRTIISPDITLRVTHDSVLSSVLLAPDKPLFMKERRHDPVLGEPPFEAMIVVPMVSTEDVTGFVLLAGSGKTISRLQPELLMAVAGHASIIADRAQLMESLRRSDEQNRMFAENAQDMVFILDRGGRFLYVNPVCRDILGYEPDEIIGSYFGEFVTAECWAATTAVVKKAVSERKRNVEYSWVIQRKDGEYATLHVRASLVYRDFDLYRHQGIARDPSTENRLKEQLVRRDRELSQSRSRAERMREYLAVANMAQEEERARIARDIHDGSVQYLVAMRRRLDLFKREYLKGSPSAAGREALEDIDSLLDTAVKDLREFARNLRPPVLDDFGLVSACEWLADQTEKEGIRVVFAPTGDIRRLSEEVEVTAFRVVQESLANAAKHSRATRVEVSLQFLPEELKVVVRDNGRGFVVPEGVGALGRAGQMGLVGMFERAEMMGGKIDLQSSPGKGTVLTVSIPLKTASRE
ncbi:MAG: PAS domain S-box protein [Bacillota bacterium]|jgi:PAS domain S-box-containing protein|nr:PAS domain S-box protein [Candidatus Fermentithermobacillaceae bacterium]